MEICDDDAEIIWINPNKEKIEKRKELIEKKKNMADDEFKELIGDFDEKM